MSLTSQQQANLVAYLVANPSLCTSSQVGTVVANLGPVYAPITSPITYTSMAAATSLGFVRAAQITSAIQSACATGNATAILLNGMLSGNGIYPTDPQFTAEAAALVAAGICTTNDVAVVSTTETDPAGCGFPQSADVTTAIPLAQRAIAINALRALAQADYQTNLVALGSLLQTRTGKCDQLMRDANSVPTTLADLDADGTP